MTIAGRRPAVGPLIAVVGSVVLLGFVVGMIWAEVTPAMSGRVVDADSALIPAGQFPEEFAGVATFALLLFGYGVVAVAISWFTSRRWRGPLGFVAVAVATVIGSLVAAWVGTTVADWRFDDPRSSPVGSTFEVVPDLWLDGAVRGGIGGPWVLFVCAPLAASLVYLGLALAARRADLGVGDLPDAGADERLQPTAQPM
ncbi:DUF2567 domain-containing protein [Gordonia sp. DT101]|uniref:DUF2567 domain-containing protein n=1 Tax=Gordonia sp. DT101 TaxID=3416545 RepID=UPI003CED0158